MRGKPLIEWHLRGAGARRRARGGDQHRLARGAVPGRARRRLALGPGDPLLDRKAATTAARWRPPAASPRRCRWLAPTVTSFWVVSGDVFAPGLRLRRRATPRASTPAATWRTCGWCPTRRTTREGDFALQPGGRLSRDGERAWTYASLALLKPAIVAGIAPGSARRWGRRCSPPQRAGRLSGEPWRGEWHNVGTPAQLAGWTARSRGNGEVRSRRPGPVRRRPAGQASGSGPDGRPGRCRPDGGGGVRPDDPAVVLGDDDDRRARAPAGQRRDAVGLERPLRRRPVRVLRRVGRGRVLARVLDADEHRAAVGRHR
ncbi:MAG: hypothetical protein MZW92_14405 [Comamonadaceae bacterium]|nr:hypothetical protein [Comamonadaceae bacterium]